MSTSVGSAAAGDVTRRGKILCLATYPRGDASLRHRVLGYVDALEARGWEVRLETIVDPRLFAIKNRRGLLIQVEKLLRLAVGLARRVVVIARAGSSDAVWIHREAFPFLTPLAERLLRRVVRGVIVLDVDDALYEPPPGGGDWRRKLRRPEAYAGVVMSADIVVAGSPNVAAWAREHGGRVVHVPTCVDTAAMTPKVATDGASVTVGWIGSWSTTESLLSVAPALRRVAAGFAVRLLFVGSFNVQHVRAVLPEAEWRIWRAEREASDLAEFDIGIMPLPDTPWNRGKGAFKVIQYMAIGIPFVASPVGMSATIANESGGGLLCEDEDAWVAALGRLAVDPVLRSALGRAGRAHAERMYDRRSHAATIVQLFEQGRSGS